MKVGTAIRIDFYDHVEDGDKVIPFTVYGRLIKSTANEIVVDSWHYTRARYRYDSNVKRFAISRRDIVRLAVLVEETIYKSKEVD